MLPVWENVITRTCMIRQAMPPVYDWWTDGARDLGLYKSERRRGKDRLFSEQRWEVATESHGSYKANHA